jgi:hypothetical protein
MSRGTEKYGRYYWCAKVLEDVSPDREIYVQADTCKILPNGELVFYGHTKEKSEDERPINLALAPGKWYAVYAASVLDGAAVAVEHRQGEVVEPE